MRENIEYTMSTIESYLHVNLGTVCPQGFAIPPSPLQTIEGRETLIH